jgi:hypothetical protein
MVYCIKTYKEKRLRDTKFAKVVVDLSDFFIKNDDKFNDWIKKSQYRKIFIPIKFIFEVFFVILIIAIVCLFYFAIFHRVGIFKKGKEYKVEATQNENFLRIIDTETTNYEIFYIKLSFYQMILRLRQFEWLNRKRYSKYFVNNIKEFRKIKLKKLHDNSK